MGRITVEATIENGTDSSFRLRCGALVDTGAAYLTLPNAWRDRLGQLTRLDTVDVETAPQAVVSGDICGPVLLRLERFRPVLTEVLFIEMEPTDGQYEPPDRLHSARAGPGGRRPGGTPAGEGEPRRSQVIPTGAADDAGASASEWRVTP